ncbi:PREDICTED: uncharacterized protein LOC109585590 [Amphimedon queenslandica]|uniref:Uncharacterized protein n=1 Tax=Amphimedon queenslandica TaxID=400682 RepID=A0A1X7TWH1_AMPQE|nr:PREDICTED: uncharacterized protein LOC109585590 [Amphimedon queenslandica]|eukprot:XP_019857275.1 PREDICTED: uncharacterized protein LOC109585590 [Amphimedon queenslandica]
MAAPVDQIPDIEENTTEDTDQREQHKAFRTEITKIGNEKTVQIFKIAAIEVFGVQVAQVEKITSFSEVYELIEKAITKDVAPYIVHEILEFIESIQGLDPDVTRALKEKARAAITDKVDIKSKYPNLEFVLTLGVMVSSMEENDYEKFDGHLAKKILKTPHQQKMERCMIIHELIQRKHLNLKPNHSNDTRETMPRAGETVATRTEGLDPANENIKKISKWLDQSSCTTNWDFIEKYCERNGIKPPKKGNIIGKKKTISLVTLVVSAVTIICLLLGAFILVIIFFHESSENTIEINTYQNQTLLLMSYNSQTISINVSLNVEDTIPDLVNFNVYTSNTVPNITLQDLLLYNLHNLSSDRNDHGSHYNYNYMDGDIPIFLQKGSSINYTLHFTSTCTGVIVTNNSATLYLFDNVEDYKHFKSKHSNVPVAISHFDSIDNLFWSFSIKYDSLYYVGLQIEDCCLVSGNVTVTQASYESSTLRQVCKTLDVSRPYCVIDLPHHFTDCDNKGHVFVSIPAGDALTKISYRSKFYYFSCIFALIAVPLLIGLLLFFIVIVPCVYVCKYSCNFCRRPADYNSLNSSDSN